MSNITINNKIKKILFIGAGANDFGREAEHDAAIYQVMPELRGHGIEVFVVDENPYALSLESLAATTFWEPLTIENLKKIVKENNIDTVAPLFGGEASLRLWAEVVQSWEHGDGSVPNTLGLSIEMLLKVNNIPALTAYMAKNGLPVINNYVLKAQDEANELLRELQLPLMIRALHPNQTNTRHIVERLDDFEEAVNLAKLQSVTQEVIISKAINGLKEVSIEVLRDFRGNKMQIGASEDMDPIGIHTADSLSVSPILTIQDQLISKMRDYAFRVADILQLQGVMHVQFAVDDDTNKIYIIKVSPYIDQMATRMSLATGYPTMLVTINLALGVALEDIVLPHNFGKNTAIMEPMMDHVVVKLPVFPFGELAQAGVHVNRQLNSVQKSIGTTLGFGRTFIEALEKAIRSAHFNNASFSPTNMAYINDDELIQQLIHPQDNRVLLLIEAIKRGYEIDELAELTAIDEFYFYQLKHLHTLEEEIEADIDSIKSLRRGKKYGLSDGLLARFWHTDFNIIRTLAKENHIDVTYKAVEPSAGEFPENARQYYATYESENESVQINADSVLVIGSGAFRMGDAASGGYATTITMSELRRLQYPTIIMNNNPSDATLLPHLADKQYLEPLEISDVMRVVELEKPQAIVIPGNRRKLIKALRDLGQQVIILPKEKHTPSGPNENQSEFALNLFYDGQNIYPINLTQHMAGEVRIIPQIANLPHEISQKEIDSPGVYQIIWYQNTVTWIDTIDAADIVHDSWLRPMPFGQIAYMTKVMDVQWIRLTIRAALHELTDQDVTTLETINQQPIVQPLSMVAADVNYRLHLQPSEVIDGTRFEIGVGVNYYE
ncbi:MAG: ATP-grasp domain-containing protein [Leuconostoc gelidum]|jgi:carbamoyl-phosphate synthase large subunit|uniref:ATP-grasp domain-containing protein n=1 Tax=Leuconostoc gelidum subsp. gelidum TaxID=1607839 RepID=A0AB35FX43_LEUGE|nr:ATP-grasp domain-containing protein [Leuconostoc gelidum]AFS40204.1 carbamoyl-phosphate synthase large chain [Leuconostoc gelidum JB7]MBZ5964286.1 ATP-grasp domain-containing protein [Leuconostoc gelidum subsp. gelidum]MBZ5975115.1 ATP-grasp domain-containing protein [Leuconostoc gelidum subsp. gelidum]MBZ5976935.1 ATP-grasp domain-containing protein [Leuconostoc gelidum subsp. gelidum]MBZ5978118.1 ATP-grasp domain-containing protein [Leuconostoc gelidum subsp. gelidum]